jgi:hypothetical protein
MLNDIESTDKSIFENLPRRVSDAELRKLIEPLLR